MLYSQFIYGKFPNVQRDYCLIARTADLTNEEHLKNLAEHTHRFWLQPPVKITKVAGIFPLEKNLVLVQAETAHCQHEQEIVDGFDRSFNQHRYIFIPIESVAGSQVRTFQLLSWVLQQPIPVVYQSDIDRNFPSLEIPLLTQEISISNQEEVDKIQRCMKVTDTQGKSLLLSALAILLNGQRLLLSYPTSDTSDFLESLLLLLPAGCRNQIPIAVGTLDEGYCCWAQLLVKTNNTLPRKTPDNLITLNFSTKKIEGQFEQKILESQYISDFIQPIVKAGQKIYRLIQELDKIPHNTITLDNLTQIEKIEKNIIVRFIPILPDESQASLRHKYLSDLNADHWEAIIPFIANDDQESLMFAWSKLIPAAINQARQNMIPLLDIWKRLLNSGKLNLLGQLQQNLPLAEILLKNGLLDNISLESHNFGLVKEVINLCKNVVIHKSQNDWNQAWQLVNKFATHTIFQDSIERFWLLDTVFGSEVDVKIANLYDAFNFKFATLLPHIEAVKFQQSNLYKKLAQNSQLTDFLNTLLFQKSTDLEKLINIGKLSGMKEIQQDDFCVAFLNTWVPSYAESKKVLIAAIENKIYSLTQTFSWFENQKPGLNHIVSQLKQNMTNWHIWEDYANYLYETSLEAVKFLDRAKGQAFVVEVIVKYLPMIAHDEKIRESFLATSCAWKNLQSHNLTQLVTTSSQYVVTLTKCLVDSSRLDWINGDLLHYLCQEWMLKGQIDLDLKTLITTPSITKTFKQQDWLELQILSWNLRTQLQIPPVEIIITEQGKIFLRDRAIDVVASYTEVKQTQRLLGDCEAWGLDSSAQIEIIKSTPPQARNIDLILKYLDRDVKVIVLEHQQRELLEILLQTQVSNQVEIDNFKEFSIDALTHLLSTRNLKMLGWWRNKAVNQQLYTQGFTLALRDYVLTNQLCLLINYIEDLRNYPLLEESKLMSIAIHNYVPLNIETHN